MSETTWLDLFKRNKDIEKNTNEFWDYFWDLDIVKDHSKRTYLKRMAIDRVINFVARTFSTTEFRYTVNHKKSDKLVHKDWMYRLNVRPNKNQSSTEFWQKLIYKLIYDNEVLVVMNETQDLLIADSFVKTDYANYLSVFSNVTIDTFTFERNFYRSDVWYITYNNEELENFIAGLYGDYGELFGRMIEINMRNNQIRGVVGIDATKAMKEFKDKDGNTSTDRLKGLVNKMFSSFKTDSVAIVPKLNGFEYSEVSNQSKSGNQSVDELKKLKDDFISEVASAIGVPPSLILGEMAQAEEQTEFFLKFTLKPLIEKVQSELTSQIISKNDYMNGHSILLIGADTKNILELSSQIDKAIASGGFTGNEIRIAAKYEPIDGLDEVIRTKNYEEVKGGEDSNDETT